MSRECVTHHFACDCREADFAAMSTKINALRAGAECMDMIQHDLVEAGIIPANVPPMFYPEAIAAIARERDALKARIDSAPVGKVASFTGTGSWHVVKENPAFITVPLRGKRVALVLLDQDEVTP